MEAQRNLLRSRELLIYFIINKLPSILMFFTTAMRMMTSVLRKLGICINDNVDFLQFHPRGN